MYCVKCGKEIPDDAQFCSECGTKVGGGKRGYDFSGIDLSGLKKVVEAKQLKEIKRGMEIVESCKWFFFASIIGLIISLFFLGTEMFEVTIEAFWTHTETFTMFEGKDFLKVLFIFGYIAAAVILIFPLITGKDWELGNFYLALGVPVLAVLVLLFVMISAKNGMAGNELLEAVDAKVKVSANGWLFIIINALTACFVIKSNLVIAEAQENRQKEGNEAETVPGPPYWCAMCGEEGPYENEICPKCGSKSKRFFRL